MNHVPLSFEFFPPKTDEGLSNMLVAHNDLNIVAPQFFSVTYGAGGSTQDNSWKAIQALQSAGAQAAPHLSCIGATKHSISAQLAVYQAAGITRIIALRGDLPSGYGMGGEFKYASDLVAFIRETTGDWFTIYVAAYPEYHPQAKTAAKDLDAFVTKIKAGTDAGIGKTAAITQYFFNSDAYYHFCDEVEKRGVNLSDTPIIPGIMPITQFGQLARFSEMCGAEIPRWMRLKFESMYDDTKSIAAFGEEVISDLSAQLLSVGCPALHFYTMNRAAPTLAILNNVGLLATQ
jgi:methylenetetrahydrofolate reductase (NADPH)